jgi:2-oxoacid:acceptor oxidoreductase delta subunit (pyruvate/2-ketoisovalerate family)
VKILIGARIEEAGSSIKYKTGGWRSYRPVVDKDKCTKCWLCYKYCPDAAVKKGQDCAVIDYDYCKGCGVCAKECKFEAIKMVPEVK